MKSVRIYVEGGGPTEEFKSQLRVGLDQLFAAQKTSAQRRRMKWRVIPSGSRRQALEAFIDAWRNVDSETIVVLLVDSEDPLPAEDPTDRDRNAQQRRSHLIQRDGWNELKEVSSPHVHLMVQCMEAWIVADPEALARFYDKGFHANRLPARRNLEDEPKTAI